MVRNAALVTALIVSGYAAPVGATGVEMGTSNQRPEVATVCEINKEATGKRRARKVSITTSIGYDFEYGYQLWDHGCEPGPRVENLLPINFPRGTSRLIPPSEFPELAKLHSDIFLRAAFEGKKAVYCRCVGEITYPDGIATFLLHGAEVYLEHPSR
jgi:hypothetical protein